MAHRMEMFLQVIAVQFLYVMTYLGVTGFLSLQCYLVFLLFPPLIPLYLIWLWFDWETPSKGGRPIQYCYLRNWRIFNFVRNYYPINLYKTSELDPERNYIFGYHPHGMIPEGALVCFGTESAGFTELFPGIKPRVSMHFFNCFFGFREIAMAAGTISVSRESLEYVLTQQGTGHSVVIVIGGTTEVLNTAPSLYHLVINKRKGFVRLALETGSSLVPVFSFGQNDLFSQPKAILSPRIERWLPKWPMIILKYSLLAYHDHSTMGITPRRVPIDVVVGPPINVTRVPHPTDEQIDDLQTTYIAKMTELFEGHKEKYGIHRDTHIVLDTKTK
ncbi:hypothetical protein QZH41_012198 [Actinostola sp. cb2023]|nr:hypothetical protein QZH41_012198 [Actinostola sp. cb2023]